MHHGVSPDGRPARHYGVDWLRIGAFALLIPYHVGMVFAPWPWVIKAEPTHAALIVPMALLTPWRLALLFAVSGYASRKLLARAGGAGPFLRSRTLRLIVPLAFGMEVLVPSEMWVRVLHGGYPHGYLRFWTHDYWRLGMFDGVEFPSWEHLWFVVYLWAYTVILGLGVAVAGGRAPALLAHVASWFDRHSRLLLVPLAAIVVAKLALLFVVPERQGLFRDWSGHAEYWPIFLIGVLMGGDRLWPAIGRAARPAAILALASGIVCAAVEVAYPGAAVPSHEIMAIDRMARAVMAWTMVLALFHLAHRWLNRDHRWRARLAQAVFPAYLVHQPAIVVATYWVLPLSLPPVGGYIAILALTLVACGVAYVAGRRIGWLGALLGLPRPLAAAARPAHGPGRSLAAE